MADDIDRATERAERGPGFAPFSGRGGIAPDSVYLEDCTALPDWHPDSDFYQGP